MITPAMIAAACRGMGQEQGSPSAILAAEEMGAIEVAAGTMMPLDLRGPMEQRDARDLYVAAGFTFGAPIDEVFQEATMPPGWTRIRTRHQLVIALLDQLGRTRCLISYKAAFYDRRASARLLTRYSTDVDYLSGDNPHCVGAAVFEVLEGMTDQPIAEDSREAFRHFGTLPPLPDPESWPARSERLQYGLEQIDVAEAWLDSQAPNWRDPLAYWDEPRLQGDPPK